MRFGPNAIQDCLVFEPNSESSRQICMAFGFEQLDFASEPLTQTRRSGRSLSFDSEEMSIETD